MIVVVVLLLFGFFMVIFGLSRLLDQGTPASEVDDVSSGGRHLEGKPLVSDADWDLWWVMKGHSDGFARHLTELEREIESSSSEHPDQALKKWMATYDKYRAVCLRYGIWNVVVGDKQTFTASSSQIRSEVEYKKKLRLRYEAAEILRKESGKVNRAKRKKEPPKPPASVFIPGNYAAITRKDRYKVLYTVSY